MNAVVQRARHPQLRDYIHSAVSGLLPFIQKVSAFFFFPPSVYLVYFFSFLVSGMPIWYMLYYWRWKFCFLVFWMPKNILYIIYDEILFLLLFSERPNDIFYIVEDYNFVSTLFLEFPYVICYIIKDENFVFLVVFGMPTWCHFRIFANNRSLGHKRKILKWCSVKVLVHFLNLLQCPLKCLVMGKASMWGVVCYMYTLFRIMIQKKTK